jgi:hypothetical protein
MATETPTPPVVLTTPSSETLLKYVTEINASITELTILTNGLTKVQTAQITKLKRVSFWTIAIAIISLVLVLGAITSIYFMYQGAIKLGQQTEEIAVLEKRTSTEVLCPLYALFLGSYNPNSPNAKENPEQYERSFKVIEDGAKILGCKPVEKGGLVPKPR